MPMLWFLQALDQPVRNQLCTLEDEGVVVAEEEEVEAAAAEEGEEVHRWLDTSWWIVDCEQRRFCCWCDGGIHRPTIFWGGLAYPKP